MIFSELSGYLFGKNGRFFYLLVASIILLSTALGGHDLWTQEHRWADIVSGMFYRHDFLHPYLDNNDYYDKPLLSYWLIAVFAKLSGGLTAAILRLPSMLAGLLAIWSIYFLGIELKDKSFGLLAGWLLLTTFYFVFWARVSSADMLNLAGSLFAIAWYFKKRHAATFFDYVVFFIAIALTALCKGLIGVVIPVFALIVDMLLTHSLKRHLRFSMFFAALIGGMIYLVPFVASSYFSNHAYHENGLYLVYRENILRYFQPFDHQGPIYTYLLYLPIYLLPWTIFLVPAIFSVATRFKSLTISSQWIAWTLLALFVFLTLSGSRRSYYVLPLVPFAILLIADWIVCLSSGMLLQGQRGKTLGMMVVLFWIVLWMTLDIVPAWYDSQSGAPQFAALLKKESSAIRPWSAWHIVMLDAESKLNFYLSLPPTTPYYAINGSVRRTQTSSSLRAAWPILSHLPANTIFVTRKQYLPLLLPYFHNYQLVMLQKQGPFQSKRQALDAPCALVPRFASINIDPLVPH